MLLFQQQPPDNTDRQRIVKGSATESVNGTQRRGRLAPGGGPLTSNGSPAGARPASLQRLITHPELIFVVPRLLSSIHRSTFAFQSFFNRIKPLMSLPNNLHF